MDQSNGLLRSTSSAKDSIAPELTWESVCAQLRAWDFGYSSAGASCAPHPEKATQQYSIMLATHFDTVCQLKTAIGAYLVRWCAIQAVRNRSAPGFARSVSQLQEAAAVHALIAENLIQLSRQLSPRPRENSRKLPKKKSTVIASVKRRAKRKTLKLSSNSRDAKAISRQSDGRST